jgi:dihydroorotate dehydrogenase
MNLRGTNFFIFVASGALNFFGEGWKFHKLYRRIFPKGFDFSGATFVSKTTTLNERKGNMELDTNLQPRSLFPDCVRVYPIKGVVLNSVGLSGVGAENLFARGLWQRMANPFFISFMSVEATKEQRVEEAKSFARVFAREMPSFSTKVGLELNISCPNTAHCSLSLIDDAVDQLQAFSGLGIPVILKVNALTPIEAIVRIAASGLCDAILVSNTIPWGQLPDKIDWRGIFGSTVSPLRHLGSGGLSGYPLLSIVAQWIFEAKDKGVSIPIIGGGGILRRSDVDYLHANGADAVSIGIVAIIRPWRVRGIIEKARQLYGGE